jgi:hypothetical protein
MWFPTSFSLCIAVFVDISASVVGKDGRHWHERLSSWFTAVDVLTFSFCRKMCETKTAHEIVEHPVSIDDNPLLSHGTLLCYPETSIKYLTPSLEQELTWSHWDRYHMAHYSRHSGGDCFLVLALGFFVTCILI